MGCNSSLVAALAACGVCSPLPPARDFVLVDQVDSSRGALGKTVRARLESIDPYDNMGRKAHIRSIALLATIDLVVAGATNDVITARALRGIWQSITLEDFLGHKYYPGLSGRVISDDNYFRFWRSLPNPLVGQTLGLRFGVQGQNRPTISTDNGLAVNAGAATYTRNISQVFQLGRPMGMGGSPFSGLIPLQMLLKKGKDAFRFNIGSALPTSPAGVTLSTVKDPDGNAGIQIWAEVIYLPGYSIDAEWGLDAYQLREKQGELLHPDELTEYAWIRYNEEDASEGGFAGLLKAGDHTGVQLECGGKSVVTGYTGTQMAQRMLFEECAQADGPLVHNNAAMVLPSLTASGAEALMLLPQRNRDVAARGPVKFKYATRAATFTSYIHRTVKCSTKDRAQKIADALDCDPCRVLGTDSKGNMFDPQKTGCPVDGNQPVFVVPNGGTSQRLSRGYGT